jgi:2-polyprenyl-6-methoxyphenol hydroxylase-like FAD-dependent oxidoreductase
VKGREVAQGEALRVVILGAGSTGASFAAAFADAGAVVTLVDPYNVTRLVALRDRLWRDVDG